MEIKIKDLVTLDFGPYSNASNTYEVAGFGEGDTLFLTHPLVDGNIFVAVNKESVNKTVAKMKNPTEMCLDFGKKYKDMIGYKLQAELDSLCFYFFVKKFLTPTQKESLAEICSKISIILLKNDLSQGIALVNKNNALLDDYNKILYENMKPMFEDATKINNKNKRFLIQKVVGFIMAQLENGV
jgi:hypothetical protein